MSKIKASDIKQDANQIVAALKTGGGEFFVAGVPTLDQSGVRNVTKEDLAKVAAAVQETQKNATIALISAGKTTVSLYVSVAADNDKVNAVEFGNGSSIKVEGDAKVAYGEKVCDPDKEEFTLKVKDMVTSELFAWLRKSGVMGEDSESEEELYGFDD